MHSLIPHGCVSSCHRNECPTGPTFGFALTLLGSGQVKCCRCCRQVLAHATTRSIERVLFVTCGAMSDSTLVIGTLPSSSLTRQAADICWQVVVRSSWVQCRINMYVRDVLDGIRASTNCQSRIRHAALLLAMCMSPAGGLTPMLRRETLYTVVCRLWSVCRWSEFWTSITYGTHHDSATAVASPYRNNAGRRLDTQR